MAALWNMADVWEVLAARFSDNPCLLHGELVRSWGEFDRRASGLAAALGGAGLRRQDKVAQYCRNRPEYLESYFACFKGSFVPVNTNFRYGDDELCYLFEDSDTMAVVFDAEFTQTCDRLRQRLPAIRVWLRVGDDASCPSWAVPYEQAVCCPPGPPPARSGDDLILLYTGGTTGWPKGVMWRQHDFFLMLEKQYGRKPPEHADPGGYLGRIESPGPRVLPAPPLMHGTASWFAMAALSAAGSVVTLQSASFDPVELLDTLVASKAKGLCIVGDPFARPILQALANAPGRWDLRGVRLVMSSGTMLSAASKQGLLAHMPAAKVVDGLGSSESGSLGSAVASDASETTTARFRLGPHVRVIDESGADVVPGSGEAGRLAIGGHLPLGYYKDPEKTAATFVSMGGERYVVAGDWATVEEDGTVRLLGRGSSCINTAGEKVYPEEVEDVLKQVLGVHDVAVVGLPDERFGEAVVALVAMERGALFDPAALVAHAKGALAGFKAPKEVLEVEAVRRHPNGKLDYQAMREEARRRLTG